MSNFLLDWDTIADREYELGVSMGVLFPQGKNGVAWSGLSAVNEKPSGAEETKIFADNMKFLSLFSAEEYGLTIEAYTYPDEWMACDGSAQVVPGVVLGQQKRSPFGFCYRTEVGNEEKGEDYGYKLHLVWNCKAQPSERNHETINDSPDLSPFSWEVTTTSVKLSPYDTVDGETVTPKPLAHMEIDTTKLTGDAVDYFKKLESILYGTPAGKDDTGADIPEVKATLPTPDQVIELMTTGIIATSVG